MPEPPHIDARDQRAAASFGIALGVMVGFILTVGLPLAVVGPERSTVLVSLHGHLLGFRASTAT